MARQGEKFNGAENKYFGKLVKNYRDPFVFTTCDIVCKTVDEGAKSLKAINTTSPKPLDIILDSVEYCLANQ